MANSIKKEKIPRIQGAFFRELFESFPDAVLVGRNGNLVYFNKSASKLLRVDGPRKLKGKPLVDFFHADSRRSIEGLEAAGTGRRQAGKILARDGQVAEVEVVSSVLERGGECYWVLACHDVTQQHTIHHALEVSEERFRLYSDVISDAIWDWNLDTGELWWSEAFKALFGYERHEIGGTIESWSARIHPDERGAVVAGIHSAVQGKELRWAAEYRFQRKDGSYAFVKDRGKILRGADGVPLRMVGGVTDLTDKVHADERLREQASLLDEAQDAILVCDLAHRVLYWNRSAGLLYGWTGQEAPPDSAHRLLHRDGGIFDKAINELLEKGEWSGEVRQRGREGRELVVQARYKLLNDPDGRAQRILAINTDVTERKKLEAQFLRAQRMESIGTLAGGIAHDLNNVLSPILMAIGLLKEKVTDREDREVLDVIAASARRGADMVRQVLSFARGIEGRRLKIRMGEFLRDFERIIRETFPKNIGLSFEVEPELWSLAGDPTQLHQLLLNFCVNARDAMPDGGHLLIRVENCVLDEPYAVMNPEARPGPYVLVRVEDSGSGIEPEILDKIFEPFFTTKEPGIGTGLGLSTSLAIVKSHGGFVRAYSEPGKGTQFKIYLPAGQREVEEAVGSAEEEHMPRGQGELVLVVDDEAAVRQITRQTLEAFGYRVLVAADGVEAVSTFAPRQTEIEVVLTDMMMPVMDGPALIQILDKMKPGVRIVAASGINANGQVARALNNGVRHFLPKPYTAETLLKTLRRVMEEGRR